MCRSPIRGGGEKTAVPEESAPLAGTGTANQRLLAAVQQSTPQWTATLDVDATILEAHKHTATIEKITPASAAIWSSVSIHAKESCLRTAAR